MFHDENDLIFGQIGVAENGTPVLGEPLHSASNPTFAFFSGMSSKYGREDLNLQAFRHRILSPTCLPIPPRPLEAGTLENRVRQTYRLFSFSPCKNPVKTPRVFETPLSITDSAVKTTQSKIRGNTCPIGISAPIVSRGQGTIVLRVICVFFRLHGLFGKP